jgi:hypothetical protein
MGWKSTIEITRDEAIRLIFNKLSEAHKMSDNQLADVVESLGYGDDPDLPYFGHNFIVKDNADTED